LTSTSRGNCASDIIRVEWSGGFQVQGGATAEGGDLWLVNLVNDAGATFWFTSTRAKLCRNTWNPVVTFSAKTALKFA